VIRPVELKHILGRRLVRRLLEAKLIVPSAHDARGHPLFDAESLHRTLGALARGVGLVEPRDYQPGNGARRGSKKDELDELLSNLARSLE
jgi:hypothetical protein